MNITMTSTPEAPEGLINYIEETNYSNSFMGNTTDVFQCSNNSSNSKEIVGFALFKVIIDVFVVGFLCAFGFVGNALTIAVLYRDHDRKNTTNWLLQTLAVTDTLYLLACVFIQPLDTVNEYTDWAPGLRAAFPYIEPFMWVFASITQTITIWMVMLVTIDRYIAICMPLTQLRSVERAKITVIIIVVAAVIYNIPRCFEREIVHAYDPCLGHKITKSKQTAFRENKIYFLVYKTICYFIFRAIGPLVILILLNLRLIQALREVRRKHKDLNKSTKNRENITLMLVAVVTVFIICSIPGLTLRIIVTIRYFSKWGIELLTLQIINTITNMLLTVNSSINFLLYCLIGKKFRRILQRMFCMTLKGGVPDVSETEPLTCRTQITKNGTSNVMKDGGDVTL